MTTAITYCRVSSDEQAQKDISIPAQHKAIHRWAETNADVTVLKDFVDSGISAYAPADKRPGFCDMVSFCRKHKVDLILVHKLDRFSRNREESILFKSLLRKHGVTVKSITENYDPDTPQGFLYEGMIEVINQFYSMNLATETLKGMKENAERGYHNGGRVPYAYRLEKTTSGRGEHSKLILGPEEEVQIVRELFRLATEQSMGVKSITNALNRRGVPAPRGPHWNASSISHILKNRVYLGDQVWMRSVKSGRSGRVKNDKKNWIITENAHPAIISRETFDARQVLAKSRRFETRSRKKPVSYLLSRIMVCGGCGGHYHGRRHRYTSKKTGITKDTYRYYCGTYLSKGPSVCKGLGVRRDWADEVVMRLIRARLSSSGALSELTRKVEQRIEARRALYGQDSRKVDKKLAEIAHRIDNDYKAIGAGMDPVVCQRLISALTAERTQLEEEAAVLQRQDYYDRAKEKNLSALERFAALFESGGQALPFAVKRQIVLHFVKSVEIRDRADLVITLRVPLDNEGITLLTDEMMGVVKAKDGLDGALTQSGSEGGAIFC